MSQGQPESENETLPTEMQERNLEKTKAARKGGTSRNIDQSPV